MAPHKPQKVPRAQRGNKPSSKSKKNGHPLSNKSTRTDNLQDKRRSQIIIDYARLYNGQELEQPLDEDFEGFAALPRKGYYLRLRQLREQVNSEDRRDISGPFYAPAPWVPPPEDDDIPNSPYWDEEGDEEEDDADPDAAPDANTARNAAIHNTTTYKRSDISTARQKYYTKFSRLSKEFVLPEDESEEEELPEHVIRKTPPNLMGIPGEIRMSIYRLLLTTKNPISVHGGWTQVYRNEGLGFSTNILRVCKTIYGEASAVLYGKNIFLYRLRDPTYPDHRITNLATDDTVRDDDDYDDDESDKESDSGSEYEEEGGLPCQSEKIINIDKYAHLFRKIIVEAEQNRYSKGTQESMAAAIRVFAQQGEGSSRQQESCNIHTLTIRVAPTWQPLLRAEESSIHAPKGYFTFVDFFLPDSPVNRAIKAVDCQIFHVTVLTRHMSSSRPSSNTPNVTLTENGAYRLTVNRRHERLYNMAQEGGLRQDSVDKVMRHRIVEMAQRSANAIDELASHIERLCTERNFRQEGTLDMDMDMDFDELIYGN